MSDVMKQCVPLSTGVLSADQRVNYQFGLVLGVDEFEQEDLYFRERDERATRTYHGYGTAVGLHVTAERPAEAPADVEVKVTPGIAADKPGRPVVIPSAQCARVGAWIAAQEKQAAADEAAPPLEAHLSPSGDVTLYVVAEYGSCFDALVPLPGNPCGSDDEVTAASRVRDSWRLGFRWEPPDMTHWDGVRALADIMLPIELDELSPIESDEELLAEHIRALAPGAPAAATPLPAHPLLPASDARAAFDRLLTIWITEVRPTLSPNLIHPEGDPAILLSAITVVPADPFVVESPAITSYQEPDDEGRPYLAPTQLIQELVLMGGGARHQSEELPVFELASVSESAEPDSPRRLVLWFHLPGAVTMPIDISVSRAGAAPVSAAVVSAGDEKTFLLLPSAGPVLDREQFDIFLDLTRIQLVPADAGRLVSVADWLKDNGLEVVGRDGTTVTLHYTTATLQSGESEPPPQRPVLLLASAHGTGLVGQDQRPAIEVWFHVDEVADTGDERITRIDGEGIEVWGEVEENGLMRMRFEQNRLRHNVYQLVLDPEGWKEAGFTPYMRVLVHPEAVALGGFGGNCAQYAEARGILWHDTQRHSSGLSVVAQWVKIAERRVG